ncbi:MAG: hypothetical protein JXQ96_05395 [Cyclobacteriaceae bacterium]
MTVAKTSIIALILCLIVLPCLSQETVADKVATLSHTERAKIKKPLYEFLHTWNTAAPDLITATKELESKKKENKRKGKDLFAGTKKLKEAYDELVELDGKERSFIAESFALPMQEELEVKGATLSASDIYAVQYITKFVLGVPRFNRGHLDIYNVKQMEEELSLLIKAYPDNDAHNQEVDGHVIDIFREEAQSYWNSFVAVNKAQYQKDNGRPSGSGVDLKSMNCGEKYAFLKEQGVMR